MLKGHALAYHMYDEEFRSKQNGKIGIVEMCATMYSKNKNDYKSPETGFAFDCGNVLNPIFSKDGDYPEIMKSKVAYRSKILGLQRSRLPVLTKEWIEYIKGTSDYLGLNHYTSNIVEALPKSEILKWPNDEGLNYTFDSSWPATATKWIKLNPRGFGDILRKLKDEYGNPPIYVLENGVSDSSGDLNDDFRINNLYLFIREMLIAIHRDGCNVQAYTLWSFLDGFEWNYGYTSKFGIVKVDHNDKFKKRIPKKSAFWIKAMLKYRQLLFPTIIST